MSATTRGLFRGGGQLCSGTESMHEAVVAPIVHAMVTNWSLHGGRGGGDGAVVHGCLAVGGGAVGGDGGGGGGVVVEEGSVHGVEVAPITEEALHVTAAERRKEGNLIIFSLLSTPLGAVTHSLSLHAVTAYIVYIDKQVDSSAHIVPGIQKFSNCVSRTYHGFYGSSTFICTC